MSGGNCPETPRQKMIGMMYMMLTAMLALNVSGDLLNAFILVDKSIKESTKTVDDKNKLLYYNFEAANSQNPNKVGDKYKAALDVKAHADSLYNLIANYKLQIIQTADGPEATEENYVSVSNQDVAAQVMLVEQGGARGKDLRAKIEEYKEYLVTQIEETDTMTISAIRNMLATEDPIPLPGDPQVPWQAQQFEHLPMAASMALMSTMQSNVRNTQADVVNYLYKKIDEASFKFNTITPLIIPESSYVLRGGQYKADIMLAAYDDTMEPIVTVGGQQLEVEAGRGKYQVSASSVGAKSYEAKIEIPDPITGEMRPYMVKGEYEVGEPSVVVSAAKMNVFYIGLDNPVEISAAGLSANDLKVTATGANIKKQGSQYVVNPSGNSAKAVVSVSADVNGTMRKLGEKEFRIMRMPPPEAVVGGLSGGKIRKAILTAQAGVFAEMKDFVFDVQFKVTQFSVSTVKAGFFTSLDSKSNTFTKEQKAMLQGLQRGAKFYVENIEATGPGGKRKLSSLSFTVD